MEKIRFPESIRIYSALGVPFTLLQHGRYFTMIVMNAGQYRPISHQQAACFSRLSSKIAGRKAVMIQWNLCIETLGLESSEMEDAIN